jgi:hypothetical protein
MQGGGFFLPETLGNSEEMSRLPCS